MPLLEAHQDACNGAALDPNLWVPNGALLDGAGRAQVPAQQTAGVPSYLSMRGAIGCTWTGSSLTVEIAAMPTAGTAGFAQVWVMDPAPADTVARLGFEYRAAANALDLIGQSSAGYTAIGTTTTLTYSATTHRWLRIRHTGTSIVWDTSPDGITWTLGQRTLAAVPTWANKTTLIPSFEAYRTAGANDALVLDNINMPPTRATRPVRALAAVSRSYSY